MSQPVADKVSFFRRLAMAFVCFFRLIFRPSFALAVRPLYLGAGKGGDAGAPRLPSEGEPQAARPPPEEHHASGLFVLSMLQREGRLIDFLQEDITAYADADVGAAARVVHQGCRKVVRQYLALEPVLPDSEGAAVRVPEGFDAQRIRLTGNVAGKPPFTGALRHHGWVTKAIHLPEVPSTLDPRVLAPAEVELA